ncbi:hypothetical protein [Rufibacter sp. LB8]|uniref:hypothetical protein n=1 Tax=Rufibacter sp. LB8 TaxID=2777781 RepID=UPI00178C746F|nr:hypothetical protein [Rufibacter sp. LB8]
MLVQSFHFEAALKDAMAMAQQMVRNGLYSRFSLSEEARVEKAMIGCLGELAFEHCLHQLGIQFEVDRAGFEHRKADAFDFKIGGRKIDVKVARKSVSGPPQDSWTYGYPQEQKPQTKDFVVVGWVDFEAQHVQFYGWTTGLFVSQCPVVTQNRFARFPYRTPNHEFAWGQLHKNFQQLFRQLSHTVAES